MFGRLLSISLVLLIFSCSKSENSVDTFTEGNSTTTPTKEKTESTTEQTSSSAEITPPSWIIGTWVNRQKTLGFQFDGDDMVITNGKGTVVQSFKKSLSSTDNQSHEPSTKQTVTEKKYRISYQLPNGLRPTYEFVKKSESVIIYQNSVEKQEYTKQ